MGLKDAAKRLMAAAGVPVTPGYLGDDQAEDRLEQEAGTIGYPVLIKAVAGGGGKGMRKVERATDFLAALAAARREAQAAFGDGRVLLERYASRPRHIEVQVFADARGGAVHLYERDCSLQRRHQKVIEEAPAPGMNEEVRAFVCTAAVKAARAVGYVGAGTVEFIADASEGLRADRIWFMEMNTRLQVEHPVTEAVTGLDLVEWQLRVAAGEPLPLRQDEIRLGGCAVEARLYAENPATGFLPSTGPLTRFRLPDAGVRVDSGAEEGGEISPFYDPMIAKLIAHAPTRRLAAEALAAACRKVEVWPVRTNAAFLARCLEHPDFLSGEVDTGFIEARLAQLAPAGPSPGVVVSAARALVEEARGSDSSPWSQLTGFRLGRSPSAEVRLQIDGQAETVDVCAAEAEPAGIIRTVGGRLVAFAGGQAFAVEPAGAETGDEDTAGDAAIRAPMPGRIVAVQARAGETVRRGAPLLTLEAMKMEHALAAPFDGVVAEVMAKAGDQVSEGALLARLDKAS